ncbi:hypothetical protein [Leptolyngbya sp. FACHB-711]|uniref:hypothetical protein n=1 Tax=unclassified Leptolyngbya TaxID=2650499 RepID=UPI001683E439|nr:hypothetical protein [Leptolyngbya sp. FACHB-711]MBD1851204.1 hypothetical protein [Cyanobacteria bacterium FACHB-502]MBD2023969.1 hypothetical protein [Leptolyngbya sp. FACHB-711]
MHNHLTSRTAKNAIFSSRKKRGTRSLKRLTREVLCQGITSITAVGRLSFHVVVIGVGAAKDWLPYPPLYVAFHPALNQYSV